MVGWWSCNYLCDPSSKKSVFPGCLACRDTMHEHMHNNSCDKVCVQGMRGCITITGGRIQCIPHSCDECERKQLKCTSKVLWTTGCMGRTLDAPRTLRHAVQGFCYSSSDHELLTYLHQDASPFCCPYCLRPSMYLYKLYMKKKKLAQYNFDYQNILCNQCNKFNNPVSTVPFYPCTLCFRSHSVSFLACCFPHDAMRLSDCGLQEGVLKLLRN